MNRFAATAGLLLLLGGIVLGLGIGRARAFGVPQTSALTYSGSLLSFGQPDNSAHMMSAALYANGSTTPACSIDSQSIVCMNGHFTLPLPDSCADVIHQNPNVQIQVTVDSVALGLTSLGAVPYALESATGNPPGTVIAYAAPLNGAPPAGWLLCNGQAVSRTAYGSLFAVLGTSAGAGDGSTTFNVPNYQGYFLRGFDPAATVDVDAASRAAMASGGNTGNAVGTIETNQLQSHVHGVSDPGHAHGVNDPGHAHYPQTNGAGPSIFVGDGCNPGSLYDVPAGAPSGATRGYCDATRTTINYTGIGIDSSQTGVSIQATGGNETRPVNATVNYLIKY
jgi:hypothetical protein